MQFAVGSRTSSHAAAAADNSAVYNNGSDLYAEIGTGYCFIISTLIASWCRFYAGIICSFIMSRLECLSTAARGL